MNQATVVNEIIKFDLLKDIPREQIEWVVERGELIEFEKGEIFFHQGDPIDRLFFILDGTLTFRLQRNGQYKEMGRLEPGDISGALPYSRAQTAFAIGQTVKESRVFFLNKEHFRDLICDCHELTSVLVHQMTDRVRSSMRNQQQDEKLMALGKLSAGLAHELNNPAAAIVRSSESLQKHLGTVPDKFKRMMSVKVDDAEIDFVNDLLFSKIDSGIDKSESLMARTEREDDLTDWLEDNGFGDCYALSETLADFGFCTDDLEGLLQNVSDQNFSRVIEWIDNVLTTEKMVSEIKEASDRISKLVNSVKGYSHMDRSTDLEPTDVHEGIHNTLSILNHKFRKNKVELTETLDEALPKINAAPGQLNQVWTNVLDNALDALEIEGGNIHLSTKNDGEFVKVLITDNGPGIPEDIQDRIFDPFFTTKDIGKGTGLGLEAVKSIVDQHNGSIKLNSQPGETTFEFCFPINS